jgi:hypothetical protein
MDDHEDPTQKLAQDVISAWHDGLSDAAQASISDYDLNALTHCIVAAFRGDQEIPEPEPADEVDPVDVLNDAADNLRGVGKTLDREVWWFVPNDGDDRTRLGAFAGLAAVSSKVEVVISHDDPEAPDRASVDHEFCVREEKAADRKPAPVCCKSRRPAESPDYMCELADDHDGPHAALNGEVTW